MRLLAIDGLTKLGDRDVIPLLQNLALNDSFQGEGANTGTYPVRKAAAEALKQLQ
jgi:HEAT repeat protein